MVAAGSLEPGYQLIVAHDALARYCIFAIGRRRFAVDWMTGITKLLPGKGNPSVPVIPFPNPGNEYASAAVPGSGTKASVVLGSGKKVY